MSWQPSYEATKPAKYQRETVTVFKVMLATPLTTHKVLHDVLSEKIAIAELDNEFLPQLLSLAKSY
ncbi:hypothetical protein TUM3794_34280 [Shewanella colwelliana]|uniref:Uncharacterized protein n=1 Tax=Shewanella colwelliana TaxID=23 RepID=A0ABQ4PBS8_SHECO|nr:hypothetical protein TUM3794_34280 [Shewanella colwelliana]